MSSAPDRYVYGTKCRINGSGDLAFEREAKPFIGQECMILWRTRAGLIFVQLQANPMMAYSFAQRNVDIIE